MNYGTKNVQQTFVGGKEVKNVTRYTESVKLSSRAELHAALDELLDLHDMGSILDPCIEIETDSTTHRVRRAIKSWSDPGSKFF